LTYFADLSVYGYHTFQPVPNPKLLNIGWLDPSVTYTSAPVDSKLVDKIFSLCKRPTNLCRGYNPCRFGASQAPFAPCPYPPSAFSGPWKLVVGSEEIRVPGKDGIVYAAPTLLCHSIEAHGYCPPKEFIEAVDKL